MKKCEKNPLIRSLLTVTLLLGCLSAGKLEAADKTDAPPQAVDLFAAMEAGDVEAKLIVKDGEQMKLVAKNKTKKPLTIKLPEAIAAVPVLAQNQGGAGGGGGGFFNVPPEKVAKRDMGFVCLEHGKPDPRSTMEYEVKPIEAMTSDPRVVEVVKGFGKGLYGHAAAQAACWHLQNQLSWAQLAGKQRRNLNGTSASYFKPFEIRQALNVVAHATKNAERSTQPSASGSLARE